MDANSIVAESPIPSTGQTQRIISRWDGMPDNPHTASLEGRSSLFSKLTRLCRDMTCPRRVVIASNRGPVQYNISEGDQLQAVRGGGGVATALSSMGRYLDFTWVASVMGEGDRQANRTAENGTMVASLDDRKFTLQFVDLPDDVYDKYYNIFCNPFLWFFQHGMWKSFDDPNSDKRLRDAWENGYVPANRAFADTIVAQFHDNDMPYIMLHDYHLYLAPDLIRTKLPHALIHHFIHIPWPQPNDWKLFHGSAIESIIHSLCCCDIVGMQTMRDVDNFLLTCDSYLDGAQVDYRNKIIKYAGRQIMVNAYPISIDVSYLEELAGSTEVMGYQEKLDSFTGKQTIVRVDRLEPTKNIINGFHAYDLLLAQHPDLVGKVNLLAFLVPSRTELKIYQQYTGDVFKLVEEINTKYGRDDWQPIYLYYEHNYPQAIAGMCLYDVLLVNALIDGMNLVTKEGPIVNKRDGVLILSEQVGSYQQLGDYAISVAPIGVEETAQALYQALNMPGDERKMRSQKLKAKIREEDISHWLWRQLSDLQAIYLRRTMKALDLGEYELPALSTYRT